MRQLFFFAALLTMAALASAGPFTNVVVFGDSLSDNGNVFKLTGEPPAPYYNGRYSNGPLAVEYVANAFGAPLIDYAYAGSTTGVMLTTFDTVKGTLPPIAPSSLFIVWGGPNDLMGISPADAPAAVAQAVTNLLTIVGGLQAIGAQHILVPSLPDLGLTPRLLALGPDVSGAASVLTDAFNATLKAHLPPGVAYYDTAALLRSVSANPEAFGFTNATMPCFDGSSVCPNPDQYVFWDGIHPTTQADQVLARGFESAAVPEPAAIVLVVAGLGVIATVRRSRR